HRLPRVVGGEARRVAGVERHLGELEEAAQGRRLPDLAQALGRGDERAALAVELPEEAPARGGAAGGGAVVVRLAHRVRALAVRAHAERGGGARGEGGVAGAVAVDLVGAGEEVDPPRVAGSPIRVSPLPSVLAHAFCPLVRSFTKTVAPATVAGSAQPISSSPVPLT